MGNLYSQIHVKTNHFVSKPYHCFHTMDLASQATRLIDYHTLLSYTIFNHIWVAFHAMSIWSEPSLHVFPSQICVTSLNGIVDSKGWNMAFQSPKDNFINWYTTLFIHIQTPIPKRGRCAIPLMHMSSCIEIGTGIWLNIAQIRSVIYVASEQCHFRMPQVWECLHYV